VYVCVCVLTSSELCLHHNFDEGWCRLVQPNSCRWWSGVRLFIAAPSATTTSAAPRYPTCAGTRTTPRTMRTPGAT